MNVKYMNVQFVDKNGYHKDKAVDKVFWLAVVAPQFDMSKSKMFHGINIGISIPHPDKEDARQFYDSLFDNESFKIDGFVEIHLMGFKGEKIPVIVGEANGYEEEMGTSCLFGYINPLVVANDERPVNSNFGNVAFNEWQR